MVDLASNARISADDGAEALLSFLVDSGKMNVAEIAESKAMLKENKVGKVVDLTKIKVMKSGRHYIHVGTKLAESIGKEMFAAKDRESLIDKLYEACFGENRMTLRDAYHKWQKYRYDIGTSPKTMKENNNDWNRFFEKSELADMPLRDITVIEIKDFFMIITKGHAITYKRFICVRGLLNGIMLRCIELGIIKNNPVMDIDYTLIKRRCKPVSQMKKDYTPEEKRNILEYLRESDNIYDLAVRFAFNVFLRIGEIISLKYADVSDGFININRSTRREQEISFGKDGKIKFGKIHYETEERLKGNTEAGFHAVPLNKEAYEVIEKVHMMNPDDEYLFMNNGNQLEAGTFNRHIRKACEAVGVEYRPSHQIRFTNAAIVFDSGIRLEELSSMLGHTNTATTLHYIRRKEPDKNTAEIVRTVLTA